MMTASWSAKIYGPKTYGKLGRRERALSRLLSRLHGVKMLHGRQGDDLIPEIQILRQRVAR